MTIRRLVAVPLTSHLMCSCSGRRDSRRRQSARRPLLFASLVSLHRTCCTCRIADFLRLRGTKEVSSRSEQEGCGHCSSSHGMCGSHRLPLSRSKQARQGGIDAKKRMAVLKLAEAKVAEVFKSNPQLEKTWKVRALLDVRRSVTQLAVTLQSVTKQVEYLCTVTVLVSHAQSLVREDHYCAEQGPIRGGGPLPLQSHAVGGAAGELCVSLCW